MNFIQYLKSKFLQGSIGPGEGEYQGECISFCHAIAEFGQIGDSIQKKKAFVNANGIINPNIKEIGRGFRIGDIVITTDNVNWFGHGTGHGFIVIDQDENYLYAGESNFGLKKRITYGRKVAKNDPKIYGIIRAPLKVDLGQVEVNVSVLINNQKWSVGFLDALQKDILEFTDNKLKVNFFPLLTKYKNWWYETTIFPMTGQEVKVIAKAYMDAVSLVSGTSNNKPADVIAFIVKPKEWEGTITGGQELAYTNGRQIQASCAEFDISPWYYGMPLIEHVLTHELSHVLHDINGMNDTTHIFDNKNKQLEKVFSDLDFNRVKANL
jgi:hypothetical protein